MRPSGPPSLAALALSVALLAAPSLPADDGYVPPSLVRIEVEGDPMPAIQRVFDAGGDVVARGRGWIDALLPQEDVLSGMALSAVGGEGGSATVLRLDADEELRAFADKADAGAYHTYAEVEAEIQGYLSSHGDIVSYESIGTSVEGRPIHAVKITGPGGPAEKPTFLICGLHHSREWISVEVPMGLIQELVEGYADDPAIREIVDTREIWVIPVVNPDGLEYSQTEYKMWRKNRRQNGDGSYGVDPNRNYGYNWGLPGASDNPRSETYRGPEPFSEPEIQAVRDLALREGVVSALSFHSYSELVLWPWGYTYDPAPDDDVLAYHGRKMGEIVGYTPQQSSDLYPTSGDFDDWFYGELGALCYTFELGTQFVPPESQIEEIVTKNVAATRYFLEHCADPFPLLTVREIADTTDVEGPYVAEAQLSRRYRDADPVVAADLVYSLPGAPTPVRVPMTKGAEGVYSAVIPGTGAYGSVAYHVTGTSTEGVPFRFPKEGEHAFQVVEQLAVLVDDDKGAEYEGVYEQTLGEIGMAYRTAGASDLSVQDLLGATAVIWLTGDDSSQSLTDAEQELLRGYLEAGGELLLFGQDIGYDIKGSAFYSEVLRAEFVEDNSDEDGLEGVPGSFLEGFQDALNQSGAVAQRYPEVVAARAGATPLVRYAGGDEAGALAVDTGTYRVAYFGFGLEGLSSPETRREVLEKGLAWVGEAGSLRTARRARALRDRGGLGSHPQALARLEAEVLDEARRLGRVRDVEGLDALRRELADLGLKPLLRAFWQAVRGR